MRVKLFSFLIFCPVVFGNGTLFSKLGNIYSRFENRLFNHHPLSRNDRLTIDYSPDIQNDDDQRYNVIRTDKPLFTEETTAITKTHQEQEGEPIVVTTIVDETRVDLTEPARQCPEGQSSITEKDLNDMIIFFAQANNLTQTINDSYFDFAVSVRDKHLKIIHNFLTRFQNKPTHLRHIMDDMAQIRHLQIEPIVKEINSIFPEISLLQTKYSENINKSNLQLEKFENSNKICSLNCDATEFRSRFKRSISETLSTPVLLNFSPSEELYYCTTLKDVKNKINVVLTKFKNEHIGALRNMLNNMNRNYDENVEVLKSGMKIAAVQELGTTMYDILSLEDEHSHFLNFLKGENGINEFETQISKIRKINMKIDYKTEELKNYVEKYRKYCLSCDSRQTRYRRSDVSQKVWSALTEPTKDVSPVDPTTNVSPTEPTTGVTPTDPTTDVSPTEPTNDVSPTEPTNDVSPKEPTIDVLDELLNIYTNGMKTKFQSELDNLFNVLKSLVSGSDDIIQGALINLHPIRNKIIDDLKIEEQELNNLKTQVPESLLDSLKKTFEDSINMHNKLDEALKFIQDTIKIKLYH